MGKYDGGMYETYIFGRTHITRRDADREPDQPRQRGQLAAHAGARVRRQDTTSSRSPTTRTTRSSPTLPPGTDNGQPYLADMRRRIPPLRGLGAPGLDVRAPRARHREVPEDLDVRPPLPLHLDAGRQLAPDQFARCRTSSDLVPRSRGPIQGSIAVVGVEARFAGGVLGDGYAAYSHIDARNINALADSLEIVHSRSGYNFKQNFFGRTYDPHSGVYQGPAERNGHRRQHRPPVLVQLRRAGALPRGLVGRRPRPGADRRSACCRSSTARRRRSPSGDAA